MFCIPGSRHLVAANSGIRRPDSRRRRPDFRGAGVVFPGLVSRLQLGPVVWRWVAAVARVGHWSTREETWVTFLMIDSESFEVTA